jgi:hypothetical protein
MRLDEIVLLGFGGVLVVLIWFEMKVTKALNRIDDRLKDQIASQSRPRDDIAAQSRWLSDGQMFVGKILKKMDDIELELKSLDDRKFWDRLDERLEKIVDVVANLQDELDIHGAQRAYVDIRGQKGIEHVTTFGESVYKQLENVLAELRDVKEALHRK